MQRRSPVAASCWLIGCHLRLQGGLGVVSRTDTACKGCTALPTGPAAAPAGGEELNKYNAALTHTRYFHGLSQHFMALVITG